jgi:hypothetical protein
MKEEKININIIYQLLKFEGKNNNNQIIYKKTAKNFKKKYGVDLASAPIIFTAKNCIWKLSHITQRWEGITYEYADYEPIVGCKNFFKRMERMDIYNKYYNIKE